MPETNIQSARQQAHSLLDVLPDEKVAVVRSLLEVMVEPLSLTLSMAPVEDEDLNPETAASLARSRASLAQGQSVSHEEVLSEFGL
jgi:PHD/YefM family antitoxin component YafN of YafNO toxin-antitoxin module